MNVTEAANILGIGRPALSNLLNGKASLSSDMAMRMEQAFGVSRHELIDMQAAYDACNVKNKSMTVVTKSYVPTFLQIKANDIEEWAKIYKARSRLSVFLRTLVNSTGYKLEKVEFPGNDDAERPGWDGFVEAGKATPWIPEGKSGWEFGVNQNPKSKADKDYAKSIAQTSVEERNVTTFIFVTPRRWPRKVNWEKERRKEKMWKDVRVIDASNLEEWLEQSIPAQVWMANEKNVDSKDIFTLNACWQEWLVDCEPALVPSLFTTALKEVKESTINKLLKPSGEPVIILADSTIEAVAFLHCFVSPDIPDLFLLRDRMIVFNSPGPLTKIASKTSQFIGVTANREVEKELAQHRNYLRSILVYPRNTSNIEPDIVLDPLTYAPFKNSLMEMGFNDDNVKMLSLETGRSLTVLRRHLSKIKAIQSPPWSSNPDIAKLLVPFLFSGTWKSSNDADKIILVFLSGNLPYEELEKQFTRLHQVEDSPVWSAGPVRGLVSKIDVLFSISKDLTECDIERFMEVAELVLSEDDPSLDLPEDQRWAAGIYGKTRDISTALRDGISETLVLLAVHGQRLIGKRLAIDLEVKVGNLIEKLLTPLTTRKLEAHSGDLPMYAEAAPKVLLDLIERDLESDDPQTIGLLRPVSDIMFGRCYRSGLLWALENLAWSEDHLTRTILVLGKLANTVIDDNVVNKPIGSLSAIFRYWMPQTSVPVEKRIANLKLLAKKFPEIAWKICVEQFDGNASLGHYNHKPRWRTDGHGFGEPVTRGEASKFALYALDMAIGWNKHNRETLGELVSSLSRLNKKNQKKIWDLVKKWNKRASEEDKAWLSEKIRVSTFTRRALKNSKRANSGHNDIDQAKSVYESLLPNDVIFKHEWLFLRHWVEESADELEDDELDFRKRDERIKALRINALKEILDVRGMERILLIAEKGEAARTIGYLISIIYKTTNKLVKAIRFILDSSTNLEFTSHRSLVHGILSSLERKPAEKILPKLLHSLNDSEVIPILTLCPFNDSTWNLLKTMKKEIQDDYWNNVLPNWSRNSSEELQYALEKLLESKRPRSVFYLIQHDIDKIQPKQLLRLMQAIGSSEDLEPINTYQLEPYYIRKIINWLERSGEISIDDLASLEFKYIDAFDGKECRISNLEKQIEKNPDFYVQAIVFRYPRDDEDEDPKEFQVLDSEYRKSLANASYKLLDKLARIPGRNQD